MNVTVFCAQNFQGSDCTQCILDLLGQCVMRTLMTICVVVMDSVLMDSTHLHVTVILALLETSARSTLMTVWESTAVGMEYVWIP